VNGKTVGADFNPVIQLRIFFTRLQILVLTPQQITNPLQTASNQKTYFLKYEEDF
jgi:hypothetical protein